MISWIIIGRNWGNNLSNLFISIDNQIDTSGCEIIFVDDFSTDNSIIELENYIKINKYRLIKQKKCLGRSAARNVGINNSKGEWCIFTNSNIYVNPRFIYEYKNILKSDSNDIIVGGISYECKSDRYYELYLNQLSRGINRYDEYSIIPPQYVLFGNCCIRRNLIENIQFNESIFLYGGEELELISRIINNNSKTSIIKISNVAVRKNHPSFIEQCNRMIEFGCNLTILNNNDITNMVIPTYFNKIKFYIPTTTIIKLLKILYKTLPIAKFIIIKLAFGFCVLHGMKKKN